MLELNAVERSNAAAIGETLRSLSIRAEVGSVMEGMLGDLEAWKWANTEEILKKDLEHMRAQVVALKESERLLLQREARAAAKAEEDRIAAQEIRSKFVKELWGLAREFRFREQEEAKIDQLGKKLARLEGVEADLQKTQREFWDPHDVIGQLQRRNDQQQRSGKNRKLTKAQQAAATAAAASRKAAAHGMNSTAAVVGADGMPVYVSGVDAGPGSPASPGSAEGRSEATLARSDASPSAAGGAVDRRVVRATNPFLELEKKPLLKVFVHLSAPEVLCAAQVCRSMFRKVDLMFGIGSQIAARPAPASNPESSPTERKAGGGGSRSRAGSSASTSSSPVTNAGPAGIGQRALANAFGVVVSRVEAVAGAAATLTGGGVGGGIGGGVGVGGADGIGLGAGGLSPEAVDSLSKRLTTAEMKGIIQLTERGRRLEAKASVLQAEKEDLHARLQGTESVKEFLVAKLKETEAALKRSLDEKGLTLRQSASDQEVISFLDSRTQEMERVAQETMDKAVTYQTELENARLSGQKQTKVLEDMLRFEKQRGEAEEAAFKSQKKLLVAEIKKLRTANLALKAESGDLRQQLKELRQSVSQLAR